MKSFYTLIVVFILSGPIMAQTRVERKAAKAEKEALAYEEMKAFITEGTYEFIGVWATPFTGNRISLITNQNFLKVKKDSTKTFLPFFGELRRSGGYGQNGGIAFEGSMENYQVTFDDDKHRIRINFSARRKTERFDVQLDVSHSGSTHVIVNSSNRSVMRYQGRVGEVSGKY